MKLAILLIQGTVMIVKSGTKFSPKKGINKMNEYQKEENQFLGFAACILVFSLFMFAFLWLLTDSLPPTPTEIYQDAGRGEED